MSKKSIAFFDFDGTLTTKDTLLEFIKFSNGNFRFWIGFLVNAPYLILYKLKIISNQLAKEKILAYFFNNMPVSQFEQLCDNFAQQKIPELLRPGGVAEINKLKKEGTTIVIVSASPTNWIRKWAESMNIELLATCLEIKNYKLTGKIEGFNCHGEEKVRRIKEKYNLADYSPVYAYGDTSGDRPMLSLANKSFMKPFRNSTNERS